MAVKYKIIKLTSKNPEKKKKYGYEFITTGKEATILAVAQLATLLNGIFTISNRSGAYGHATG